jgi:hypothetical protein
VDVDEDDPEDALARLRVWKVQEDGDRAPRPATFRLQWTGGGWRLAGLRY